MHLIPTLGGILQLTLYFIFGMVIFKKPNNVIAIWREFPFVSCHPMRSQEERVANSSLFRSGLVGVSGLRVFLCIPISI